MSELFKEIEDDLRQEKLDALWQKIGKTLLVISGIIVLVTIGYQILKHHKESVAMERTDIFLSALDTAKKGDEKKAVEQLAPLTSDKGSSYYGIAMLKKASLQTASGDSDGAKATYQQLAEKSDAYGQLAKLYLDPGAAPIAATDRASPFYYSLEERRGWQLFEQGKKEEAATIFAALYNDAGAPAPQRMRMNEVLQSIAPEKLLVSGKPAHE